MMGNTPVCGWRYDCKLADTFSIFSIYSSNFEAKASKLLENLEEMFTRYILVNGLYTDDV